VVLAKQKGLATHTAVARTYLTLGLILIDGLAEEERVSGSSPSLCASTPPSR
jgi:hypothetical protein